MTDPVADLLARRVPHFREPLRVARLWNRGDDPADLDRAARLLTELTARYPAALHVWYERAFNLVRRGEYPAAVALLGDIDVRFGGRLDEDTYSLWGRIHKDAGDAGLGRGLAHPPGDPRRWVAFEAADREYELALVRYRKGFALAATGFPGVNVACLTLVRAGLARDRGFRGEADRLDPAAQERADRLAADARGLAAGLLAATPSWPKRQPDDHIWHLATRGEANAVLGRWGEAAADYLAATAQPDLRPYHPASMGNQLRRVARAHHLLGDPVPPWFADRVPALAPYLDPPGAA